MNVGAILAGMGINVVVGQPVIGVFSALYSTNIGGYKILNLLEGTDTTQVTESGT